MKPSAATTVDAVMSLMTDDCLFENTLPPPDGEAHHGQADIAQVLGNILHRHAPGTVRNRGAGRGRRTAPSCAGDSTGAPATSAESTCSKSETARFRKSSVT